MAKERKGKVTRLAILFPIVRLCMFAAFCTVASWPSYRPIYPFPCCGTSSDLTPGIGYTHWIRSYRSSGWGMWGFSFFLFKGTWARLTTLYLMFSFFLLRDWNWTWKLQTKVRFSGVRSCRYMVLVWFGFPFWYTWASCLYRSHRFISYHFLLCFHISLSTYRKISLIKDTGPWVLQYI